MYTCIEYAIVVFIVILNRNFAWMMCYYWMNNLSKNLTSGGSSNTPLHCTIPNPLEACVDWVSITFWENIFLKGLLPLLHLDFHGFEHKELAQSNEYEDCYKYLNLITVKTRKESEDKRAFQIRIFCWRSAFIFEKRVKKWLKTPVTNRGVINTSKPTLISTVDWFSCTFKNAKNWKEVCGVFLLDSTLFTVQDKGRNGYKKSAVFQLGVFKFDLDYDTVGKGRQDFFNPYRYKKAML